MTAVLWAAAAAVTISAAAAAGTTNDPPRPPPPDAPTEAAAAPSLNDYPTEARAEYVFTCMAANGQTRKALGECACAIDHIATVLSYDGYVAAATVLAMRQTTGERTEVFRAGTYTSDFVKHLRAAEAEAELLCFTPGT